MNEIVIPTGCPGDYLLIHVDWYDHNNSKTRTNVELLIAHQDKPRTFLVLVNGVEVARVESKQ